MTTKPTNLLATLAAYDGCVRKNRSDEWDTVTAVATCEDGYMGAWGEVLDMVDGELDDAEYDALHDLFLAYQKALKLELDKEATL